MDYNFFIRSFVFENVIFCIFCRNDEIPPYASALISGGMQYRCDEDKGHFYGKCARTCRIVRVLIMQNYALLIMNYSAKLILIPFSFHRCIIITFVTF